MNPVRVLVLEDHPFQRAVLEHNLASFSNVEVFAFGTAQDALAWLDDNHTADIIICDLMMSGIDGLSFLRKAKLRFDIFSVVLFTSIEEELRRSVAMMVKMLNLVYLGDLAKCPSIENLRRIFEKYAHVNHHSKVTCLSPIVGTVQSCFKLNDFKQALAQGEFVGFYQPKFNIPDFTVLGAEVLVRWNHPIFGELTPGSFIEALIGFDLLDEVFLTLLEQGCRLQKHLQEHGYQLSLAYNLDITQLNSTELVYKIVDIASKFNISTNSITIEVTETGFLSAPVLNLENLIRLRMQGFGLAIDDFGSAHSSLARLCELPFSQIKLDSCFLSGLDDEPRCRAAISSVIALSQALKMELVIEGIETNSQLTLLQQLGCTIGQGFCFSRPIDEHTFVQRFFPIDIESDNFIRLNTEG